MVARQITRIYYITTSSTVTASHPYSFSKASLNCHLMFHTKIGCNSHWVWGHKAYRQASKPIILKFHVKDNLNYICVTSHSQFEESLIIISIKTSYDDHNVFCGSLSPIQIQMHTLAAWSRFVTFETRFTYIWCVARTAVMHHMWRSDCTRHLAYRSTSKRIQSSPLQSFWRAKQNVKQKNIKLSTNVMYVTFRFITHPHM